LNCHKLATPDQQQPGTGGRRWTFARIDAGRTGLVDLSGPILAFADFLRIDRNFMDAAGAGSAGRKKPSPAEIERWVSDLPEREKNALLIRAMTGNASHVGMELLRRFREKDLCRQIPSAGQKPRTVGQLIAAAKQLATAKRAGEERRPSGRKKK